MQVKLCLERYLHAQLIRHPRFALLLSSSSCRNYTSFSRVERGLQSRKTWTNRLSNPAIVPRMSMNAYEGSEVLACLATSKLEERQVFTSPKLRFFQHTPPPRSLQIHSFYDFPDGCYGCLSPLWKRLSTKIKRNLLCAKSNSVK